MDDLIDRALNHKWWYSDTNLATLLIHELQQERDEHQAATTRHAILEKKLQQQEAEIERLRSVANRGGHLAAANAEIEQLCALLSAGLSFTTMNAEQARWKRQVADRLGLTDVLELL